MLGIILLKTENIIKILKYYLLLINSNYQNEKGEKADLPIEQHVPTFPFCRDHDTRWSISWK